MGLLGRGVANAVGVMVDRIRFLVVYAVDDEAGDDGFQCLRTMFRLVVWIVGVG